MIRLTVVRELDLNSGRFLSAASGLVLRAGRAIVIADDELALGSFSLGAHSPGTMRPIFVGELSVDPGARKREKPDLEALFALTSDPASPLVAVPSGSRKNRVRGAWITDTTTRELDFTALFARLAREVVELNLEGAVNRDDSVFFFHRGNAAGSENAIFRLDRGEFAEDVETGRIGERSFREATAISLGEVAGVRLTFGDAAVDAEGRIWFLASAEATDSAYEDGAYRGAVLGRLDAAAKAVEMSVPLDCPAKPEGLAFDPVDSSTFYVVTDADDPASPSVLFRGHVK